MYKDKDHPIKDRWRIGEYVYQRCPKSTVDDDISFWLIAYNFYKVGQLPNVGGWLDQANKFNEVMLYIQNKIAEHQGNKDGRK